MGTAFTKKCWLKISTNSESYLTPKGLVATLLSIIMQGGGVAYTDKKSLNCNGWVEIYGDTVLSFSILVTTRDKLWLQ